MKNNRVSVWRSQLYRFREAVQSIRAAREILRDAGLDRYRETNEQIGIPMLAHEYTRAMRELELKTDTLRLDWLESQGDFIQIKIDPDLEGHLTIHSDAFVGKTLRAAIDLARSLKP